MKITKDFERDKEIQKKKKMAFLRNEEYKETDKEDLSDSDDNFFIQSTEDNKNINKQKNLSFTNNLEKNFKEDIEIVHLEENNEKNNLITKNPHEEIEDYFKQEDESEADNIDNADISTISKHSKAILDNKIKLKELENQEANAQKNLMKQTFTVSAKNIEILKSVNYEDNKKRHGVIDKINTRNKEKINKVFRNQNYKNTVSSFNNNNNSNKKHKRASSNFSVLKELKNFENKESNIIQEKESKNYENEVNKQSPKKINLIKSLPLDKLQDLIKSKQKKLEEKIYEDIKIRSELKADQILDISLNDYSEIELENSDRIPSSNVNMSNLNRVIRVRNILKGKHKDDDQHQYKGLNKENDDEIFKVLRLKKLGPPSFLKTNFKKETESKFRMLEGKFFGCQV